MTDPWILVLGGWLFMAAVMTVLWLVQRRTRDAGIVDVAWGLGVGVLSVAFAIGSPSGNVSRRVVIAVLAMAWALRLSGYIFARLLTMPPDGRYDALMQEWGAGAQAKLFRFYQFQALGSVLFALPMLAGARHLAPCGLLDFLAVAAWCVAIAGESLADRQLARFRSDPARRGQVCQQGLWRYSRHPNYFFEWLHWWSYVLFAVTAPWGWLTVAIPLAMLYFILFVTGIPPTEAQALRSRGEAYRAYQRTTSPFVPWFPHPERPGS